MHLVRVLYTQLRRDLRSVKWLDHIEQKRKEKFPGKNNDIFLLQ